MPCRLLEFSAILGAGSARSGRISLVALALGALLALTTASCTTDQKMIGQPTLVGAGAGCGIGYLLGKTGGCVKGAAAGGLAGALLGYLANRDRQAIAAESQSIDQQIANIRQAIAKDQVQINAARQDLRSKEYELARLKAMVMRKQARRNELRAVVAQRRSEIQAYRSDALAARQSYVDYINKMPAAQRAQIMPDASRLVGQVDHFLSELDRIERRIIQAEI